MKKKNNIESLISREHVLDVLREYRSCSCLSFSEIDFLDSIKDEIEEMPVHYRKEGHWQSFQGGFECSLCNYSVIADDVDDMFYCPNCGAELIDYMENKNE